VRVIRNGEKRGRKSRTMQIRMEIGGMFKPKYIDIDGTTGMFKGTF